MNILKKLSLLCLSTSFIWGCASGSTITPSRSYAISYKGKARQFTEK
ncbi:MAG: hypothetical protein PHY78_09940 [Desulfobacterales bacterium]|nr:hypothetical protein [Desulfobacterales bacterium]MDD4391781.1 hypothetical protein [Desulfobacterales bacterium]